MERKRDVVDVQVIWLSGCYEIFQRRILRGRELQQAGPNLRLALRQGLHPFQKDRFAFQIACASISDPEPESRFTPELSVGRSQAGDGEVFYQVASDHGRMGHHPNLRARHLSAVGPLEQSAIGCWLFG